MPILHERVRLADGAALELVLDPPSYRLSWRSARARVQYASVGEGRHRREVRGKASAYEFRSVEQMRYDFERDVEAAGGTLGAHP